MAIDSTWLSRIPYGHQLAGLLGKGSDGNPETLSSINGALATVGRDGAGAPYQVMLSPSATPNFVTNAQECMTDNTGWSRIVLTVTGISVANAAAFAVGMSTTYLDQSAVQTAANSAATKFGTPDGTLVANTDIVPAVPGFQQVYDFDASALCKTFGVMLTGAVPGAKVSILAVKP